MKNTNQSDQNHAQQETGASFEHDAIWSLLGESSKKEPSSSFVNQVMGEIQSVSQDKEWNDSVDHVVVLPEQQPKLLSRRYSTAIGSLVAAGIAACVLFMISTKDSDNAAEPNELTQLSPLANQSESVSQESWSIADVEAGLLEDALAYNGESSFTEIEEFARELETIEQEDYLFMSEEEIGLLVQM